MIEKEWFEYSFICRINIWDIAASGEGLQKKHVNTYNIVTNKMPSVTLLIK